MYGIMTQKEAAELRFKTLQRLAYESGVNGNVQLNEDERIAFGVGSSAELFHALRFAQNTLDPTDEIEAAFNVLNMGRERESTTLQRRKQFLARQLGRKLGPFDYQILVSQEVIGLHILAAHLTFARKMNGNQDDGK